MKAFEELIARCPKMRPRWMYPRMSMNPIHDERSQKQVVDVVCEAMPLETSWTMSSS